MTTLVTMKDHEGKGDLTYVVPVFHTLPYTSRHINITLSLHPPSSGPIQIKVTM